MASAPTLHIYTYRDGMLARLAHNLQLTLERFEVSLDVPAVRGRFQLDTLRVDGVVEDGRVDPHVLSESDKRQILKSARESVLQSDRYPEAVFEGRVAGSQEAPRVEGELSLTGQAQPVAFDVALGEVLQVRTQLSLRRWGIPPFKALGGAIKLKDGVDVELMLPADVAGLRLPDWRAARWRWQAPPE